MKDEILTILRMHAEGKLTEAQAAELLAVLADSGSGEKATPGSGGPGAPGPRGPAATFNRLVNTVAGVGTHVGQAAEVWSSQVLNLIHRGDGGNSITLSKVELPAGEAPVFERNVINVSTLTKLELRRSAMSNNSINASKLTRITITDGKFSQCELSGSSFDEVTIDGGGIRGASFIGSKCQRLSMAGGSTLDGCTVQSSSMRDWKMTSGAELRESWLTGSSSSGVTLEQSVLKGLKIEHSSVNELAVRESKLDKVVISGCKVSATTISGCTWTNMTLRREMARSGSLDGTTFEKCEWTDCEFVGCDFRGATVRNVSLSGTVLRGIDFSGKSIDGVEAFREAAGLEATTT
jgi:uncharacterized protein YjbI with pentapeptide repeats